MESVEYLYKCKLSVDTKALSVKKIIHAVCTPDSPFKDEGKNLLVDEFGKQYGTYFSILDAISSGMNTQTEIASALGEKSIGGQLKKLEETYGVIRKMRPILSIKGTQTVRYGIVDMFLRFWFRYFDIGRDKSIRGAGASHYDRLYDLFGQSAGRIFQTAVHRKLRISGYGIVLGNKKGQGAMRDRHRNFEVGKNKAVAVEVKRQRKEFKPEAFAEKVQHLKDKVLPKYEIEQMCLTLKDM